METHIGEVGPDHRDFLLGKELIVFDSFRFLARSVSSVERCDELGDRCLQSKIKHFDIETVCNRQSFACDLERRRHP